MTRRVGLTPAFCQAGRSARHDVSPPVTSLRALDVHVVGARRPDRLPATAAVATRHRQVLAERRSGDLPDAVDDHRDAVAVGQPDAVGVDAIPEPRLGRRSEHEFLHDGHRTRCLVRVRPLGDLRRGPRRRPSGRRGRRRPRRAAPTSRTTPSSPRRSRPRPPRDRRAAHPPSGSAGGGGSHEARNSGSVPGADRIGVERDGAVGPVECDVVRRRRS